MAETMQAAEAEPVRNVSHIVLVPLRAELENGNLTQLLQSASEQSVPLHFIFYVNDLQTDTPAIKDENNRTAHALALLQNRDTTALKAMADRPRNPAEAEALEGIVPLSAHPDLTVSFFEAHDLPQFHYGKLQATLIEHALTTLAPAEQDNHVLHFADADVTFSSRFFEHMHQTFSNPAIQSAFAGYETYPDVVEGLEESWIRKLRLINYDADRLQWQGDHAAALFDYTKTLHMAEELGLPSSRLSKKGIKSETSQIAFTASTVTDELLQRVRNETVGSDYELGRYLTSHTTARSIYPEAWVNASLRAAKAGPYKTNAWANYIYWKRHSERIRMITPQIREHLRPFDDLCEAPVERWALRPQEIPQRIVALLASLQEPSHYGVLPTEEVYDSLNNALTAALGSEALRDFDELVSKFALRLCNDKEHVWIYGVTFDIDRFFALKRIAKGLPKRTTEDYFRLEFARALKSSALQDRRGNIRLDHKAYDRNMRIFMQQHKATHAAIAEDFFLSPFPDSLLSSEECDKHLAYITDRQAFERYTQLYERRVRFEKIQRKRNLHEFIDMRRTGTCIPKKYQLFQDTFREEVAAIDCMLRSGIDTQRIAAAFITDKRYANFFEYTTYDRDFVFYSAWQQTLQEEQWKQQ